MTRTTTPAGTRTKAVAYLRVSTDKQADHGVSIDAQRAKVEAYASLYDLELVEVIVDAGASAKTLDRPGLTKALGMLKSGKADALLVAKLDRLSRSIQDLAALVAGVFSRCALLSVAEQVDTRSAGGRMVLNVLGVMAQFERETIAERTSAAMQHMRAQGLYTGGNVPYGFELASDGTLTRNEAEQEVLSLAREYRNAGLSLRAIAARLASSGLYARTGKPFAVKVVAGMVA